MTVKRIRLIALLAALTLLLCGCSGQPAQKKEGSAEDICTAMTASGKLPEMLALDGEEIYDLIGIAPEDCAEITWLIAEDGLLADEIAVLTAVDEAAAKRCEALLATRVEARKAEFENYLPEQAAVMKKAVLLRSGLHLALIVSPEAAALQAIYGEYR